MYTVPTRWDWLTVSSKTAPSLFVAAARLLDYAQKSPGTGRLTTCAVTCHRHLPAQCYSHRHLHLENSPLLASTSSQELFCDGRRGRLRVAEPGPSQNSPGAARAETSRDVWSSSTGRPSTSARAERERHVLQGVSCSPRGPVAVSPLSGTCCVEERSALRDDKMPSRDYCIDV